MLRISFSPPRSSFYSFKTRRNYRLELGMGSCSNMDICAVVILAVLVNKD